MTFTTLVRLEEAQPAMRMWKFFDNLALIQEMEKSFFFDRLLYEDEDDPDETHKHLLGLLRDVHTDHRKMSDDESGDRLKHVDKFLNDQAQKSAEKLVRRKEGESDESHAARKKEHVEGFRLRGLPGQRRGESDMEFEHRKKRWHAGHRGDGMDAKSVHSALELMGNKTVEEHLKSQRRRAVADPDLPPSLRRTMHRKGEGEGGEEVDIKTDVGLREPQMRKTEKDYKNNPPNKIFKLKKKQRDELDDLRKAGRRDEAKTREQEHKKAALRRWKGDEKKDEAGNVIGHHPHWTDADGTQKEPLHRLAYRDAHHGGGHQKHSEHKKSGAQPPAGGWTPENPKPGSHAYKSREHEGGLAARAKAKGRAGVSEPVVGSAAMNAIKASALTGHGDYHHFYEPHQKGDAHRRLEARKKWSEGEKEAGGDGKVPVNHPEHSYKAIETDTGVSTHHLINMHHGVETVPVRDIAHQIRRKSDPDYEHYVKPEDRKKKKKVAADAPDEDDEKDTDEEKPEGAEHEGHSDVDFDKLNHETVGKVLARTIGKRAKGEKDRKKSGEVARWSGLASKGEAGEGEGIAGLQTSLGKQEERKKVPVHRHTDILLKHPSTTGPKPKKGETEDSETYKARLRTWAEGKVSRKKEDGSDKTDEEHKSGVDEILKRRSDDREHHEELTRHAYPDDESRRRSSVKLGSAAKTLLHPKGSLWKEVEERSKAAGGKGSHKGVSHAIPVESQVHQHAARLLKTGVDSVLSLASTGRTGQEITRGARASKDAPSGAASGISHGEPLGALLRKERQTAERGEKPDDESRRPRALEHRPKGTGKEDYTREEELRDSIKKDLHHVFPTDREALATGGKDGKAHHSSTTAAHPAQSRKKGDDEPAGAWGSTASVPSGFRLGGHKAITHDDFDEAKARKGPGRAPKYTKVKATKSRSQAEADAENARRAEAHKQTLSAHAEEKAAHKADPEAYVQKKKAEHTAKVDAWHDFLSKQHGKVHEVLHGDGEEGRLKGVFTRYLDTEDEHTQAFHRDRKSESARERQKRKTKEGTGRVERKALFDHHLKVASQDPKVHAALGVRNHKEASQALRNLVGRLEKHGQHINQALLHGSAGVEEKLTRTPLSSQKRREKEKSRDELERHEKDASMATRVLATRRGQESDVAKEKLKAQQKPAAKSLAQKVRATDIVPMAGQGRESRRLPTATRLPSPSKPMETGATLGAKHSGTIQRYHSARAAFDQLKGRKVSSAQRTSAATALRTAQQGLKSVGLDPHNLPGVPSAAVQARPPMATAQPGRAPRRTGEQEPTPATKAAQARALPAGKRVTVTAREGQRPGPFRRPKPAPSKQAERGEEESEHQIHLQKVKKHASHVQNFVGSRDALDRALERHGSFDHPAVKKADATHEGHKAKLRELGIDPSKAHGGMSPSEKRAAASETERAEKKKGKLRLRGPIPGTVKVRGPESSDDVPESVKKDIEQKKAADQKKAEPPPVPKRGRVKAPEREPAVPKRRSAETPAPFKLASVMKPAPGKKLFVPSPEQRKKAVLHREPLAVKSRPDESPSERVERERQVRKSELTRRSAREVATEPPRIRSIRAKPAPTALEKAEAERKEKERESRPKPIDLSSGSHKSDHHEGGHVETSREGGSFTTTYTHPKRGFKLIGTSRTERGATRHHQSAMSTQFGQRTLSKEHPEESLLFRSALAIFEGRASRQRSSSFFEKVCALA